MKRTVTRSDWFRSMDDETLARELYAILASDSYCRNLKECMALLETESGIPAKKCIGCLLRWLKEEV